MSQSQGAAPLDRRTALPMVARLLRRARLVSLVGPAGAGKSALARQAADVLGARFSDGATYVDLSRDVDPELLPHTIAVALGVHDHTFHPVPVALAEYLRDRYVLLVLDGSEHLPRACAKVVGYLLEHAPGLQVLAVGTAPLGVAGERVLALPTPRVPARLAIDREFQRAATAEREAWLRLGVLSGTFDRCAAEVVAGTPVLPSVAEPLPGGRFRLSVPARRYAAGRLEAEAGERCRQACAEYFAELAAHFDADWLGPSQPEWLLRLDAERDNLQAMLRQQLSQARRGVAGSGGAAGVAGSGGSAGGAAGGAGSGEAGSAAARAALDLRHAWLAAGTLAEGRHWLAQAMELGPTPALRLAAGRLAVVQRDIPAAMPLLRDARDGFIAARDPAGYALALCVRGGAALATDQHEQALRLLDDGVARLESDDVDACLARIDHAETLVALGQIDRAVAAAEAVVAICQQRGDLWVRGSALLTVARAAVTAGEVDDVRETASEALRCQRMVDAVPGMSVSFTMLGLVAAADGDLERAAMLYGAGYRARTASGLADALPVRVGSDLDELEAAVEMVRGALGERASRAAFLRGAALSIADATVLALDGTSAAPRRLTEPGSAA